LIDRSSKGLICNTCSDMVVVYFRVQLVSVTTSLCSRSAFCYAVNTRTDVSSHVDSHVTVYVLNCYTFKTTNRISTKSGNLEWVAKQSSWVIQYFDIDDTAVRKGNYHKYQDNPVF